MLTIPWINYRGLVFTTGQSGMQQAIDMALSKEVLNRRLLSYINFRVNKPKSASMRPATPATATTILGAVALAVALTSGVPTTATAVSLSAPFYAGAVTRTQAHALTLPDDTTGRTDPVTIPPPGDVKVRRRCVACRVISCRFTLGRRCRQPLVGPDPRTTPYPYTLAHIDN